MLSHECPEVLGNSLWTMSACWPDGDKSNNSSNTHNKYPFMMHVWVINGYLFSTIHKEIAGRKKNAFLAATTIELEYPRRTREMV